MNGKLDIIIDELKLLIDAKKKWLIVVLTICSSLSMSSY
jgi:hypothetical protein